MKLELKSKLQCHTKRPSRMRPGPPEHSRIIIAAGSALCNETHHLNFLLFSYHVWSVALWDRLGLRGFFVTVFNM